MADLPITASAVVPAANAIIARGTAGAAITAGQPVYKDRNNKYLLGDADGVSLARAPGGIALNAASDGQPIAVQFGGDLTIGATLTTGTPYFLSATAGGIAPFEDLVDGDDVVLIGIAKSTSLLAVTIVAPGVAYASSSGSALLLEDGISFLLLEDGTSKLLLEDGT